MTEYFGQDKRVDIQQMVGGCTRYEKSDKIMFVISWLLYVIMKINIMSLHPARSPHHPIANCGSIFFHHQEIYMIRHWTSRYCAWVRHVWHSDSNCCHRSIDIYCCHSRKSCYPDNCWSMRLHLLDKRSMKWQQSSMKYFRKMCHNPVFWRMLLGPALLRSW